MAGLRFFGRLAQQQRVDGALRSCFALRRGVLPKLLRAGLVVQNLLGVVFRERDPRCGLSAHMAALLQIGAALVVVQFLRVLSLVVADGLRLIGQLLGARLQTAFQRVGLVVAAAASRRSVPVDVIVMVLVKESRGSLLHLLVHLLDVDHVRLRPGLRLLLLLDLLRQLLVRDLLLARVLQLGGALQQLLLLQQQLLLLLRVLLPGEQLVIRRVLELLLLLHVCELDVDVIPVGVLEDDGLRHQVLVLDLGHGDQRFQGVHVDVFVVVVAGAAREVVVEVAGQVVVVVGAQGFHALCLVLDLLLQGLHQQLVDLLVHAHHSVFLLLLEAGGRDVGVAAPRLGAALAGTCRGLVGVVLVSLGQLELLAKDVLGAADVDQVQVDRVVVLVVLRFLGLGLFDDIPDILRVLRQRLLVVIQIFILGELSRCRLVELGRRGALRLGGLALLLRLVALVLVDLEVDQEVAQVPEAFLVIADLEALVVLGAVGDDVRELAVEVLDRD